MLFNLANWTNYQYVLLLPYSLYLIFISNWNFNLLKLCFTAKSMKMSHILEIWVQLDVDLFFCSAMILYTQLYFYRAPHL